MKESLIAQPSQLSLRHFKNRILDIGVLSFKRRKSNGALWAHNEQTCTDDQHCEMKGNRTM